MGSRPSASEKPNKNLITHSPSSIAHLPLEGNPILVLHLPHVVVSNLVKVLRLHSALLPPAELFRLLRLLLNRLVSLHRSMADRKMRITIRFPSHSSGLPARRVTNDS